MSDFEISERKLRASPEFFIFFYNSFFAVASIIKGIKKSGCEQELKKKFHTADLYFRNGKTTYKKVFLII